MAGKKELLIRKKVRVMVHLENRMTNPPNRRLRPKKAPKKSSEKGTDKGSEKTLRQKLRQRIGEGKRFEEEMIVLTCDASSRVSGIHAAGRLQFQFSKVTSEIAAEFFISQAELHGSFEESQFVTCIVSSPFVNVGPQSASPG